MMLPLIPAEYFPKDTSHYNLDAHIHDFLRLNRQFHRDKVNQAFIVFPDFTPDCLYSRRPSTAIVSIMNTDHY